MIWTRLGRARLRPGSFERVAARRIPGSMRPIDAKVSGVRRSNGIQNASGTASIPDEPGRGDADHFVRVCRADSSCAADDCWAPPN